MENLYGFHCYSQQSPIAPPPQPPQLPPPSQNVISSLGTLVPTGPAQLVGSWSSTSSSDAAVSTNAFLQQQDEDEISKVLRAKVASHPLFPQLLHAYIDCQKVYYYYIFTLSHRSFCAFLLLAVIPWFRQKLEKI